VAKAVILFGPIADRKLEFTASDIAKHLNPANETRRRLNLVDDSDLEAGFGESAIRISLDKSFPMQLEFIRHTIGKGALKTNFYKIKFLPSFRIDAFTIESLATVILRNIEEEESRKRKKRCTSPPAPQLAAPTACRSRASRSDADTTSSAANIIAQIAIKAWLVPSTPRNVSPIIGGRKKYVCWLGVCVSEDRRSEAAARAMLPLLHYLIWSKLLLWIYYISSFVSAWPGFSKGKFLVLLFASLCSLRGLISYVCSHDYLCSRRFTHLILT